MDTTQDSLWLQKTIVMPDPLPGDDGKTPEAKPKGLTERKDNIPIQAGKMKEPTETLLTATPMDSSLLNMARPALLRRSSFRASVSNNSFFAQHEIDELRKNYNEAKRELLKISELQQAVEMAQFEVKKYEEENAVLNQVNSSLRRDLERANERVREEKDSRATLEAEMSQQHNDKEQVLFLKNQIEEMKVAHRRHTEDLSRQHEKDYQEKVESLQQQCCEAADELASLEEANKALTQEKDALEEMYNALLTKSQQYDEGSTAKSEQIKQLEEALVKAEQQHTELIAAYEKKSEEEAQAQRQFTEERIKQITQSKDSHIKELQVETEEAQQKVKALAEEVAVYRHKLSQLQDEASQTTDKHQRELRRLQEEYRLAVSEKELLSEASLREARSGKLSVDSENQSLRRQVAKISEELSSVAGVLALRDQTIQHLEKALAESKSVQSKLQQENDQFLSDNELLQHDLEEANEVVHRLRQENDEAQDTANQDLETYTRKIRVLEGNVQKLNEELSAAKRKFITEEESFRSSKQRLEEQLDGVQSELARTKKSLATQESGNNMVDEMRRKYQREKERSEKLELELSAVMGRLTAVESQLSEERQRFIAQVSRSPAHVRALSRARSEKVRSISSSHNVAAGETSLKRARTETARVVGTSCLPTDVVQTLEKLPGVVYADCPSNMPVPSNLTHLVTNGAMTVKLLSALVRGCWVLPESFVKDSAAQTTWLNESDYGFQHEEPPLLKKKVFMTPEFQAHKNHNTASLLLREGGAISVQDAQEADMVLCTVDEAEKYPNGITWLAFTEIINPVPIK